jgi:hypothetical protein
MNWQASVNPVQLQKYLKGLDYPASKEDLMRAAREHGADDKVVATLERLPRDRFNSPNDVSEAVGQIK